MALMLAHDNSIFNLLDHMIKYINREFKGSKAAEAMKMEAMI